MSLHIYKALFTIKDDSQTSLLVIEPRQKIYKKQECATAFIQILYHLTSSSRFSSLIPKNNLPFQPTTQHFWQKANHH